MSFKVEWQPQAFKYLEELPKDDIIRALKRLDNVAVDPFRYLQHYEGKSVHKLRIGDYRALIDVDLSGQVLLVQHFDHRGRIYKRA